MDQKKPNIVYILADDMGYGDLSCLNENSKLHTQHMDRLAQDGMVFTDAHASSSVCTPSRYSILTGRYNWRSRLKKGVFNGYTEHLIEDGRITVASLLKEQGYQTACIGKWHLGMDWQWAKKDESLDGVDYAKPIGFGPNACGFDYFYGISASLDMPPYVYIENDRVMAAPDRITRNDGAKEHWREGATAPDFVHEEVLPKTTERVTQCIDTYAKKDRPFFIYFPLSAPHMPILPTKPYRGKSATNAYGDFVLMVDDVVGEVMDALDKNGITDTTIVIVTSDNGCAPRANFEELAQVGHHPSYHFRGHKADIYEGGHRIPLLVRWPERIQPGSSCDETVCLVDFIATCADILDVPLPDTAGEDSISNLPLWLGKPLDTSLREATVHHSIAGAFSIRKGKWKLEMCPGSGGWSYPRPGEETDDMPSIQLYNLENDISETTNVYDCYPDVVEEMKTLLTTYIKNGRSTPGKPQPNTGSNHWEQLHWIDLDEMK